MFPFTGSCFREPRSPNNEKQLVGKVGSRLPTQTVYVIHESCVIHQSQKQIVH